jgi:hypothetical protein
MIAVRSTDLEGPVVARTGFEHGGEGRMVQCTDPRLDVPERSEPW